MMNHKINIKKCFSAVANSYDEYSYPQQIIGAKLIDLLLMHEVRAKNILDLGCGTGIVTKQLLTAVNFDECHALDLSSDFLQKAQQRLTRKVKLIQHDFDLPYHANCQFDLIFANMSLHWSNQLDVILKGLRKISSPSCLFAFSIPLIGTFIELKPTSRNKFYEARDIQGRLGAASFSNVKFLQESLVVGFPNWLKALRSLKFTGTNYLFNRQNSRLPVQKLKEPATLTYNIGYFITKVY